MSLNYKITETSQYIMDKVNVKPEIGFILGSGLGVLADKIENPKIIPYSEIPHFPQSTVHGHAGELVFGEFQGKKVLAMKGRFHYYEGYPLEVVTFPVRVMKALGVTTLIVTNAAGGVNESFEPGDLMIIEDHLNLSNNNPLIGPNDEKLVVRFPDMSNAYNKNLITLAEKTAEELNIKVKKGVYTFLSGPTYETPAEIKMLQKIGADAVGMSTVPEVIVAVHSGLKVLGISCITNMASGILDQPLNHEEVIETAAKVKEKFLSYLTQIVKNMI